MHRRNFLQTALAAGVIGKRSLMAAEPHLQFPAEPRARLGVASYPFRAFIDSPHNRERDRQKPGMELKDFPKMVRERFNLRNIEPLGEHFRSLEPAYLHELREAVEKAGSFEVDKVREAMTGQTFKAPEGEVTMQENHHLVNNVFNGETQANGQFKIVKSLGLVAGEPFSDKFLMTSK